MSNKTCYALTRNKKPYRIVDSLEDAKLNLGLAIVNISNGDYICGEMRGQLIAVDINGDVYSVHRVSPQQASKIRKEANYRYNQRWFTHLAKIGLADRFPPCPCKGWNN